MTYPGGKNGSGVYQAIINEMPKHRVYIEPFLGSGAVLRRKRPAEMSFTCELNREQFEAFIPGENFPLTGAARHSGDETRCWAGDSAMLFLKFQCGVEFLRSFDFATHGSPVLIYPDPPYLMETRSQKTPLYDPEFADWFSHVELLDLILTLNANVMISGYDHPLYNEKLAAWRKTTFTGFTRGGSRTECLWMNYAEPSELHDYRYLGSDYRERESIKKQQKRWVAKLRAMPLQKRYALMAAIEEVSSTAVTPETPGLERAELLPAASNGNGGVSSGERSICV